MLVRVEDLHNKQCNIVMKYNNKDNRGERGFNQSAGRKGFNQGKDLVITDISSHGRHSKPLLLSYSSLHRLPR